MIYEITGQPGHGKTLYGLKCALDFHKQGRAVYVHGIKDLDYAKTGFLPLVDPAAWQEVPDNSVIVIDECYTVFPNRNAASAVPSFVEALARHRHRGLDFILIHQQPNQVDPFVRGLVDQHTHVRRKFGFGAAVLKTWDYSTPNPIKDVPLRSPGWKYDKRLYSLYTSATMHTVQKRVPWQVYAIIPVAGFVAYVGFRLMSGRLVDTGAPPADSAPAHAGVGAGAGPHSLTNGHVVIRNAADYLRRITPRISAMPASAPAFDDRPITSIPVITCVASGPGLDAFGRHHKPGCHCITEQGTPWKLVDGQCEITARTGRPYDYYRPVRHEPPVQPRVAAPAQGPVVASAAVGVGTPEPANVFYGGMRGEVGKAPEAEGISF